MILVLIRGHPKKVIQNRVNTDKNLIEEVSIDPASDKEIKDTIRDRTNDDMVDEAKFAFESATKVFQEMMELDIEHYLEQTD